MGIKFERPPRGGGEAERYSYRLALETEQAIEEMKIMQKRTEKAMELLRSAREGDRESVEKRMSDMAREIEDLKSRLSGLEEARDGSQGI